jgi:uncharacterized protein
VPRRTVFLDTSFVLALENKDDPHHERAKALDRQLARDNAALVLLWGILLEIGDGYARIARRPKGLQLLQKFQEEEGYQITALTAGLMDEALTLYRTRPDKEWTLTDCVSFALMTQQGLKDALTADVHFRQAGFIALLLES